MGAFSGSIGSIWVEIGARIDDFQSKMRQMSSDLGDVIDKAKENLSALDIGKGLAGIGLSLSAGITAPLAALGKESIESATKLESLMNGLTAVAGSSEAAAKQFESLKEVAKLPGLGIPEAVQGSIRLQAVGVAAGDAERYLKAFGNALATVGAGKAELNGVITQLTQMATKSKVVASDLKPIMEQVPQVAGIVREAFGTIDTEVLQKMGIGSQQMINTIIAGLEKLPPVTGGLKNTFENLSDQLDAVFADIGKQLQPVVTQIAAVIGQLLTYVQDAIKWFSGLPEPVKAGALAFTAMLAALGPLLTLIGGAVAGVSAFFGLFAEGGLLAGLGLTATGFTAVAAAIPLVLAALTALGVWVYNNWDPIVATLTQAWDGVTEAWNAVWTPMVSFLTGIWESITGALTSAWNNIGSAASSVWDPIAKFFSTIWDTIAPYFTSVWNGISGTLTGIWNSILKVGNEVWAAITKAIGTFLEWAAKIPGVSKLMNLDDAWKSAKECSTQFTKTAQATQEVHKSATTAGKSIPKLADSLDKVGKSAKDVADKYKPIHYHNDLIDAELKVQGAAWNKLGKEIAEAKAKLKELGDSQGEMLAPSAALDASIQKLIGSMQDISQAKLPDFINGTIAAKKAGDDLAGAFKTLGVESTTHYQTVADEAKKAYDVIKGSGVATPTEENNAMLAMLKAQRAAAIANGETIPKEMENTIAKMQAAVKDPSTGLPATQGEFQKFGTEVSTIVTNLAQDLGKMLFSGEGSFKEKGISALKAIGAAAFADFAQPFIKAGNDLMSGVISDLMGGKGFGGIIDRIKDVGDVFSKVFGGGSGVASAAGGAANPGVGSTAGSAGGAGGGGAAGGLSGALNIAGAVGSIASAISGIVGNFQNAHQETSLNAIEHNTRYSMMFLGERGDGGILGRLFDIADKTQYLPGLLDGLNLKLDQWLQPINPAIQKIVGQVDTAIVKLTEVSTNTQWGSKAEQDNGWKLEAMLSELKNIANKQPIINVYVGDSKTPASANVKLSGFAAV